MKVTRSVILDLLPLYLAGEASEESRHLVEEYLETDPDLRHLAESSADAILPRELPPALPEESELRAFRRARRLMFQHNLFLSLAIVFTFLFVMGATFLLDDHPIGPILFFAVAVCFWGAFWIVNRQLSQ